MQPIDTETAVFDTPTIDADHEAVEEVATPVEPPAPRKLTRAQINRLAHREAATMLRETMQGGYVSLSVDLSPEQVALVLEAINALITDHSAKSI